MTERTAPTDVVEAYLLGVVADPERREASFIFRTPSGERQFGLCAHQVDELSVIHFRRQNIVHDVHVLGAASDPQRVRDLLAALLDGKDAASDVVEPTFQARLDECATAVLGGRKVLLEIEAVYGASVLLLAGSIEWIEAVQPVG